MLLDEHVELAELLVALVLGPLSHENLQDLSQPLLHLGPLQVLAESLNTKKEIDQTLFSFTLA